MNDCDQGRSAEDEAIAGAQNAIVEWLELLKRTVRMNGIPNGYTYAGTGDFLLRHGVWYEPKPLPKSVYRGAPRACFRNALALATRRGYSYVEGYAVPDISICLPIHHAWNLDKNGDLIDNTWEAGVAYLGVAFPLDAARHAIRMCGNTVLDNPVTRNMLYKEPYIPVRRVLTTVSVQ